MDDFKENLLAATLVLLVFSTIISSLGFINREFILYGCAKQHNVYKCELVAVPVKGG